MPLNKETKPNQTKPIKKESDDLEFYVCMFDDI